MHSLATSVNAGNPSRYGTSTCLFAAHLKTQRAGKKKRPRAGLSLVDSVIKQGRRDGISQISGNPNWVFSGWDSVGIPERERCAYSQSSASCTSTKPRYTICIIIYVLYILLLPDRKSMPLAYPCAGTWPLLGGSTHIWKEYKQDRVDATTCKHCSGCSAFARPRRGGEAS